MLQMGTVIRVVLKGHEMRNKTFVDYGFVVG